MRMNKFLKYVVASVMCSMALSSCTPHFPESSYDTQTRPDISPDFQNVTVPVNISPTNFYLKGDWEATALKISGEKGETIEVIGDSKNNFVIDVPSWKKLLANNVGGTLSFDVYAKKEGRWLHFEPFNETVSPDSIDRYLTYRLIEPSYMGTGLIGIFQSDLETGETQSIFENKFFHRDPHVRTQKCVNCHTAQRNHPENKMFYFRGPNGGLILTYNGQVKKINTRTKEMFAGTVYPAWHPNLPYIAFSSNVIKQCFSSNDKNKVEPFDFYSDLVLYDIEKNTISPIQNTRLKQETNPNWSPDGKYLYYNVSDSVFTVCNNYRHLLYDIYRIPFNVDSLSWGEPELVYAAAKDKRSATYPRVSPDGKFLAFTGALYGTSTQTNRTADLFIMNLETKEVRNMSEVNSPTESDSYHDWSSESRWLVVSSRRGDGNYSRPYFAHIDEEGKSGKPLPIPHSYPRYDDDLLKNYNVVEFSSAPVVKTYADFLSVIQKDEIKANSGFPENTSVEPDGITGATSPRTR